MKRLALLSLLVIANLGQAPALKGGTVTGKVNLVVKGNIVKLDEVYVYLQSTTPARVTVGKGVVAEIEQKDERFSPSITVIPQGARIFFPNRDDKEHNVFSPAFGDYYGFDLGRYGITKKGRHRDFFEAGEFDIFCDVHKEMWAKVKVVPTRYFQRAVGGKYTFTDIPPGTYTVVAWAPDSKESRASKVLTIEAEKAATAESLNVQFSPKTHVHPRIDGSEYGPYTRP